MSQGEVRSPFQVAQLFFYQAWRGDAVRGKDSWINARWLLWIKLEFCPYHQWMKTMRILSTSPMHNSFVHVNGLSEFTVLLPLFVDTIWERKQLGQAQGRC